MGVITIKVISSLLLPPLSAILPLLLGLWWLRRRPCAARWLITAAAALLIVPSLPLTADWLMLQVETQPPLDVERLATVDAGAIVVLGGGWRRAPEYGGRTTVNQLSLERLTHGVWLHRQTGLPLALTGGRVYGGEDEAEATLMARVLEHEFELEPRWVETASRNTAENAQFTAKLLRDSGVSSILLVTHAFHMPRAVPAFERQGLRVIAAPMGFYAGRPLRFKASRLIPTTGSYNRSYFALHELLGQAWYALRAAIERRG